MKKDNFVRDWKIVQQFNDCYLIGDIYNDTKKRFEDGEKIRTSKIRMIDFESGIVLTQNSVYNLDITKGEE